MANCAQLINCLNSLYLAHEDRFVVTTVGRAFELYTLHQGGNSLRTIFSAPQAEYDRDGKPATLWGLNGSASLKGKDLHLTVVNPHVSQSRETENRHSWSFPRFRDRHRPHSLRSPRPQHFRPSRRRDPPTCLRHRPRRRHPPRLSTSLRHRVINSPYIGIHYRRATSVIPNPALSAGFGICFCFSDPQSLCTPTPPRLN